MGEETGAKLWGCQGRFGDHINSTLARLNNSLAIDKRLYREDIEGSLGYSQILMDRKLISLDEFQKIQEAFKEILMEWKTDKFEFHVDDEDVHTANERRLTEMIGDVGRKLHVGRSRNEQTAVDVKLWMKKSIGNLLGILKCLINTIIEVAEKHVEVLMPGYTHLQRAQPVRYAHWLLSHAFFFQSDARRLMNLLESLDYCPLGSGAIAGNPFEIDRKKLASILGFKGLTPNSMFAVSDRDFVIEFNLISALMSTHLSRLSEDLIIFSTKEFSFIKMSGEFSTGSSLMPQKFNPDSLELIRGTSGPIYGELMNMLVTLKGLPSTYNKDLQNDKRSLFNVLDNLSSCLNIMIGVIATMGVCRVNCENALSFDMLATDLVSSTYQCEEEELIKIISGLLLGEEGRSFQGSSPDQY